MTCLAMANKKPGETQEGPASASASLAPTPPARHCRQSRREHPSTSLVFTWARPNDAEDDSKHSRVAIDIEPHGDGLVRLTVTHEDLVRDSQMLAGISGGWPKVLSNLKTLLETGRAFPHSPAAA